MGLFETIADRRIAEARAAGFFDDLPGRGKPIADLGTERPAGWWASRAVKLERDKIRHEELTKDLRRLMPQLWRLDTAAELVAEVAAMNQRIVDYNNRTAFVPIALLDQSETLRQWHGVRASG
jgi:hypothetical protein